MSLELPVWDPSTIGWTVATLGLVGASVLDRFLDDDGTDDDAGSMDGDDDIFGGGGGMGGDGSGMGGDGFDDFDGMDEWDDGFDDGGGGGSDTDELEKRLDDLEAEVATLSSTVSTVRSENEEISAAVDDIEEDVRNLLDIYEMVTRGINPFVDESSGFEGVGGGDSSFGLFDDDEDDQPEEALSEDVASADADGFFDEELVEPDDGGFDELEADTDDEFGDLDDEFDDLDDEPNGDLDDGEPADAASETEPADDGDMNDDAKSFSELKEEYDAGEADWADDAGGETADDDPFDEEGVDDFGETGDEFDEFGGPDDGGELENGDGFDDGLPQDGPDAGAASDHGSDTGTANDHGPTPGGDPAEMNGDGFQYVRQDDLSGSGRKPYLTELPADYVGDLLVMEWLEFLVSESDVTDAVRAIHYYERIEWVGADAAAGLRDFLSGFGTIDRNLVDRPGTDQLVREHHTRSLRYITQLNGTSSHTVLLDRWDDLAGGSLVGGGFAGASPVHGGRRGRLADRSRDRRDRQPDGDGRHERDGRADDRRAREEHRDGRRPHGTPRERNGSGGRGQQPDEGRSGGSTRPMNDPDPRPDHADPADGGWDNGR